MKSSTVFACAAAVFALTAGPALAQRCETYFPFEDSLADTSGSGYDGEMIGAGGAAATASFAAGRVGRALHVTRGSSMRALADFRYERCPQVTITAWIRLESLNTTENQYIFSTGQGSGPGLYTQGPSLFLNGTESGLYFPNAIRDANTWFLVAGIYDYDAGTYRLFWRNSIVAEGVLSSSRYGAEDAFWIGAQNDALDYGALNLYVDELRVYDRVLTPEEILAANANLPAQTTTTTLPSSDPSSLPVCSVHEDCSSGNYCANDNTCHPDSHRPKSFFELTDLTNQNDDPLGISANFGDLGFSLPVTIADSSDFYSWFSGTWCLNSSTRNGVNTAVNRWFASSPIGTMLELAHSPDVAYRVTSLSIDPATQLLTASFNAPFLNVGLDPFEWSGPLSSTTENGFTWTVGETQHHFSRGTCSAEQDVDVSQLVAAYFIRDWCAEDIGLMRSYFFNLGNFSTGEWSLDGYYRLITEDNDNRQTFFDWSWSPETHTLSITVNGSTTARQVSDVRRASFDFGGVTFYRPMLSCRDN